MSQTEVFSRSIPEAGFEDDGDADRGTYVPGSLYVMVHPAGL